MSEGGREKGRETGREGGRERGRKRGKEGERESKEGGGKVYCQLFLVQEAASSLSQSHTFLNSL